MRNHTFTEDVPIIEEIELLDRIYEDIVSSGMFYIRNATVDLHEKSNVVDHWSTLTVETAVCPIDTSLPENERFDIRFTYEYQVHPSLNEFTKEIVDVLTKLVGCNEWNDVNDRLCDLFYVMGVAKLESDQ